MKISELVRELQDRQILTGDVDVMVSWPGANAIGSDLDVVACGDRSHWDFVYIGPRIAVTTAPKDD